MNPPEFKDQPDYSELMHQLEKSQGVQLELDRRIFNLKTLYDVSKDIFSSVDSEAILRNFLLMVMGNFGVAEGVITLFGKERFELVQSSAVGLQSEDMVRLMPCLQQGISDLNGTANDNIPSSGAILDPGCDQLAIIFPFAVDDQVAGTLGLGPKLIDERYNDNDRELIKTLVNNLSIALQNARSIEEIKSLNQDLEAKNIQLEKTLEALRVSLRKIEILESVKESLAKFVPTTVTRLIEKSPEEQVFENKRQDVTVLFLDIENYTQICKRIGGDEVGQVIEAHFSVFMDAIYANNGDVNETAGDGLMVLYLDEDPHTNAMNAVRTALTIREEALKIIDKCPVLYKPLRINIGINSGPALVGAAKFDSLTGSRWTYTARGQVVNLAARIGGFASGGEICLSQTAAERVKDHFEVRHLGRHGLKNVSEEIDIFAF
jgi:class 3 adenylate cyclase